MPDSSATADSVRTEVEQGKMKVGNYVVASTGAVTTASALPYIDSSSKLAATTVTASKPVYIDSSKVPQTAAIPFSMPITAAASTSQTLLTLTGYSSLSGEADMTLTFATGTTLTTVGYLKISLVDSGGNITNGDYYIPFGTIA